MKKKPSTFFNKMFPRTALISFVISISFVVILASCKDEGSTSRQSSGSPKVLLLGSEDSSSLVSQVVAESKVSGVSSIDAWKRDDLSSTEKKKHMRQTLQEEGYQGVVVDLESTDSDSTEETALLLDAARKLDIPIVFDHPTIEKMHEFMPVGINAPDGSIIMEHSEGGGRGIITVLSDENQTVTGSSTVVDEFGETAVKAAAQSQAKSQINQQTESSGQAAITKSVNQVLDIMSGIPSIGKADIISESTNEGETFSALASEDITGCNYGGFQHICYQVRVILPQRSGSSSHSAGITRIKVNNWYDIGMGATGPVGGDVGYYHVIAAMTTGFYPDPSGMEFKDYEGDDQKVGFFVDNIGQTYTADPPHGTWTEMVSEPQTSSQSSVIIDTVADTMGFSATGGFASGQPMGNITFSYQHTTSHATRLNIEGFRVYQSGDRVVSTGFDWFMSMIGGDSYHWDSFKGAVHDGNHIRTPPYRAQSGFQVGSVKIWQGTDPGLFRMTPSWRGRTVLIEGHENGKEDDTATAYSTNWTHTESTFALNTGWLNLRNENNVGTPKGTERIQLNYTGAGYFCLDVRGGGTTNGTNLQIWNCYNIDNMFWHYNLDTGEIKNPRTGMCIDNSGARSANGNNIQLYTCNGTGAQRWEKVSYNGTYYLRNPATGKCLDRAGGLADNGANVQLWDCVPNNNQLWNFIPVN